MSEMNHPQSLGSTRLGFADEGELDRFVEKLEAFERGEVAPDAWRAFRLVHGVYGQRQDGPMMVRCKIPQGVLTPEQLIALAEVSERWSNGKGHITTRQNVQYHFVKMEDVEAVVLDASHESAASWTGTLAGLGGCELPDAQPESAGVLVIGEVVSLAAAIAAVPQERRSAPAA